MKLVRGVATGAVALAMAVPALVVPAGTATAKDQPGKPYPSLAEVVRARAHVEDLKATLEKIAAAQANADQRASDTWEAAEVASERYNRARWEAQVALKAAKRAAIKAVVVRRKVDAQRVGIAMLVAQSYQDGAALNDLTTMMGVAKSPADVMQRAGAADSAGLAMKLRYDEYAVLSDAADAAEAAARKARKRADALAENSLTLRGLAAFTTLAADRAQGQTAALNARYRAKYAAADEQFRTLQKWRRDALTALKDDDPANDPGPERKLPPAPKAEKPPTLHHGIASSTLDVIPRSYPGPVDNPPPPDPKRAHAAIAFAREQIGDMYLWGATGPNRWDCSGLTMAAMAAAGISLPHYSEAQYLVSTPISAADLAPGDLVFWQGRQERIHHVALYIGRGRILHARQTGMPVLVEKLKDFTPPDYFARP